MTDVPERTPGRVPEDRIFELRVPARPELLKLIRATVGEAACAAGCSEGAAGELVVAVDEACQNVIRYAYRKDPGGEIVIRLCRDDGRLVARVIDFAPPIDPEAIRPRPLDELRPGGLGTRLIRESVDEVAFETPEGCMGNVLRLTKRIA